MYTKHYYYYTYEATHRQEGIKQTWNDVYYGYISDLILQVHIQSKKDEHYTDFKVTFYAQISVWDYQTLKGEIG